MKKLTPIRMALGALAVVVAAGVLPATAAPVCTDPVPAQACVRIFAEPYASATFIQHDSGEYEAGIKALAAQFPRFVRVRSLEEILGDPQAKSVGGRPIWVIEVTDFEAPEEAKVDVVVSLSVHGPERAGLEGGVRYAEDLARWATTTPAHQLMNGTEEDSIKIPVGEALQKVHLYLADINPDGWAKGDLVNGGVFTRGNNNGVDLNREFPTIGWTKTSATPLSEPESVAWDRFVKTLDPVTAGDLHGETTSANNAFADIMLPAGQWNPLRQAQEERLARHMRSNVDRYFREQTIALGQAEEVPLQPAEFATGYDVVGYDDAGFMGDYFTQLSPHTLDMDVEHLLSHMVPNSAWVAPLEAAHVAAVRAEIETLMVEALASREVSVSLDIGKTGYLFDPRVVTDSDANGYGDKAPPDEFVSYSVTPMRYFEDLGRFTTEPLRKVASGDVDVDGNGVGEGLNGLDSFVVTTWPLPPDAQGRTPDTAAVVESLVRFTKLGGNLILTDEGLKVLEDMGVVAAGSVTKTLTNAGHIDITNFADDYAKGLNSTASQTYYEVPLGYTASGNAPHWSVPTNTWTAASLGGVSVGTVANGKTGLGRLTLGQGTIGILGALLPPATEKNDHYFGLADYGVTVTGGQIFNNMLGA